MKRKTIFAIPNLKGGGVERLFVNLLKQFQNKNMRCVCLLGSAEKDYEIPQGVRIVVINQPDALRRIAKIKSIIRRENPDTVISFLPQMNVEMTIATMEMRPRRLILTQQTTVSAMNWNRGRSGNALKKSTRFYRFADVVVAASKGVKKDLVNHCGLMPQKIKIINNGVDLGNVAKLAKEKKGGHPWFFEKTPIIINVASLQPKKGQAHLLKALAILKKKTDCRLIVLGEGPLENKLKLMTRRLGIEKSVYFLGFQKNPFKFLKRAKIFVLSSICEGFPTVILEAMALGIPVVSTDCPSGPGEMIKNGSNGILVQPANAHALARAIQRLLKDAEVAKRLVFRAKKRVERYKIQKIAEQYLSLIRA